MITIIIITMSHRQTSTNLLSNDREDTAGKTRAPRKILFSKELFGASRELAIIHEGEEYRLRITGKGKLILTK
jgi:hemin uptake protein HemP